MITVTDASDSGPGTLRQAIADAAVGEEIQFGITGTISIDSELAIGQDLTITGPGAANLTVERNGESGDFRIFNITAGTVVISGITMLNGNLTGANKGAGVLIAIGATLSINDCVIDTCDAVSDGAAVYNFATLHLTGCTIQNCEATGSGGGLYNNAEATLNHCIFINNISHASGGAVANAGELWLTSCTIGMAGNQNQCLGPSGIAGGLWNQTTATVVDTVFDYNQAAGSVCENVLSTSRIDMLRCRISHCTGGRPAFVNQLTAQLEDVTISNNAGNGFYNDTGTAVLARVTFSSNGQQGINNNLGAVYADTCTVSGNTQTGAVNNLGSFDLRHSTITKNGNGGFLGFSGSSQSFENNIISGNTIYDLSVDDIDTTSVGHNIYGVVSNPLTLGPGDLSVIGFANLGLGLLANNGGSTLTHAVLAGSPAIDAGNTAGGLPLPGGWTFPDPRFQNYTNTPPIYDQRMASRVQGTAIDIGAVEFPSPYVPPTPPTPPSPIEVLVSEMTCYTCLGIDIGNSLELALLTAIVKKLDPDMNITPQSLLDQGQCFGCYGLDTGTILKLVLLTLIYNLISGGTGAPQCISCGAVDPTVDPDPCSCAWYINLTNSTTWYWDDPANQWFKFG